ncbi:hypothetical protein D3C75_1028720 [compost metagenome]
MVEALGNHVFTGIIKMVDIGAVALPFRSQTLMNIFEDRLRANVGTGIGKTCGFGPLRVGR